MPSSFNLTEAPLLTDEYRQAIIGALNDLSSQTGLALNVRDNPETFMPAIEAPTPEDHVNIHVFTRPRGLEGGIFAERLPEKVEYRNEEYEFDGCQRDYLTPVFRNQNHGYLVAQCTEVNDEAEEGEAQRFYLAAFKGRNIYILFDIFDRRGVDSTDEDKATACQLFIDLVTDCIVHLVDNRMLPTREEIYRRKAEAITNSLGRAIARLKELNRGNIEQEISSQQRTVEGLQQSLIEATRSLNRLLARKIGHEAEPEDQLESQRAIIASMVPTVYTKFEIRGSRLDVDANPFKITYEDVIYETPALRLQVNLENGRMYVKSQASPNARDLKLHPHVNPSDGSMCWGNMSGQFRDLVASYDIAGVLQMMRSFLSSYNPDSPFFRIQQLKVAGRVERQAPTSIEESLT